MERLWFSFQRNSKMQIAIFDYFDSSITIFPVPAHIEQAMKEDEDFDLNEWVENLPGYTNYCYWMTGYNGGNISVRIGNQNDFPEFSDNG